MHLEQLNPAGAASVLFLHGGNVTGWMWQEQAAALPGHHCLIPDLPGFGRSAGEPWTDLATVADDLANVIQAHAVGGRAHVVGLSLGAVVGTVLAARHPQALRSAFLSGAALRGVRGLGRVAGLAQLSLWGRRGYWLAIARAYRLPADSVGTFVDEGLAIDRKSARRLTAEVFAGVSREHLDRLGETDVPILALAGERDHRSIRRALTEITSRARRSHPALVPGMHHVWSAEDPVLFHRVLAHWLANAEPSPELEVAEQPFLSERR